ncbi:amidohydrolase family protein [candidate division CSSED10-310 bacterium]|uniref:Amidohydrolase family protein n=1 Tax=candidate division CSSED10-310 bacterium TaxID=2855610 RepID=A0ABV6YYE5_UNCC1
MMINLSVVRKLQLAFSNLINGYSLPLTCAEIVLPEVRKMDVLKIDYENGLLLKNVNVVDVITGKILDGRSVEIRDGMINSITEVNCPPHNVKSMIDLQCSYLLPGLIDAHCHSTFPSTYNFEITQLFSYFAQIRRNYLHLIKNGITTIRDMGAFPLLLDFFIKKIDAGSILGPRIQHCYTFTNVHRGHPDINPMDLTRWALFDPITIGNQSIWFNNNQELIEGLEKNLKKNASFIKLTLDDISILCGGGKLPTYNDDNLKTILRYAKIYHLPLAGHTLSKFGFDRALQYGINSIEHSISDAFLSDEDVTAMASKRIANVPTLLVGMIYAAEEAFDYIPDEYQNHFIDELRALRRNFIYSPQNNYILKGIDNANKKMLKYYKKYNQADLFKKKMFLTHPDIFFGVLKHAPVNLHKMKEAGILIGCGTDGGMPYIPNGCLWLEMSLLSKIGFSNAEILRCATLNNAKILHMSDKIGSIDKGKLADLVVVRENPLQKLETCRRPAMVIKDGRIQCIDSEMRPFSIS